MFDGSAETGRLTRRMVEKARYIPAAAREDWGAIPEPFRQELKDEQAKLQETIDSLRERMVADLMTEELEREREALAIVLGRPPGSSPTPRAAGATSGPSTT